VVDVTVPVVVETPPVLPSTGLEAEVETERAETVAVVVMDASNAEGNMNAPDLNDGDGRNRGDAEEEEAPPISEAMTPPLPSSPTLADSENNGDDDVDLELTVVKQEEPEVEADDEPEVEVEEEPEVEEKGGDIKMIRLIIPAYGEPEAETGDATAVMELPGHNETL